MKPIDKINQWRRRIKNTSFGQRTRLHRLRKLSLSWHHCACCELNVEWTFSLDGERAGIESHRYLDDLGCRFFSYIINLKDTKTLDDFNYQRQAALDCLDEIEEEAKMENVL